uniref:Uncharacterized protein n=1 Tax=Anopheles atroparvus TaxID=41427 RepID=A0A182IQQ8_ANOAO
MSETGAGSGTGRWVDDHFLLVRAGSVVVVGAAVLVMATVLLPAPLGRTAIVVLRAGVLFVVMRLVRVVQLRARVALGVLVEGERERSRLDRNRIRDLLLDRIGLRHVHPHRVRDLLLDLHLHRDGHLALDLHRDLHLDRIGHLLLDRVRHRLRHLVRHLHLVRHIHLLVHRVGLRHVHDLLDDLLHRVRLVNVDDLFHRVWHLHLHRVRLGDVHRLLDDLLHRVRLRHVHHLLDDLLHRVGLRDVHDLLHRHVHHLLDDLLHRVGLRDVHDLLHRHLDDLLHRCWLSPTAASGASEVVSITPLSERVVSSGVLRVCVSVSPSPPPPPPPPPEAFFCFLPFGLVRKMWIFLPVWRFSCFFTACHWRSSAGVCSSIDRCPFSFSLAPGCSFLLSNSSASAAEMTTATDATSIWTYERYDKVTRTVFPGSCQWEACSSISWSSVRRMAGAEAAELRNASRTPASSDSSCCGRSPKMSGPTTRSVLLTSESDRTGGRTQSSQHLPSTVRSTSGGGTPSHSVRSCSWRRLSWQNISVRNAMNEVKRGRDGFFAFCIRPSTLSRSWYHWRQVFSSASRNVSFFSLAMIEMQRRDIGSE